MCIRDRLSGQGQAQEWGAVERIALRVRKGRGGIYSFSVVPVVATVRHDLSVWDLEIVLDDGLEAFLAAGPMVQLSLIHISEPTRLLSISYAVFCLKKKKSIKNK
eukprot:TRINITY_DN57363_c0_g1_i1.p1 TRINITY_DN57363_c0_g1~~TRINITY_DN57363_c0_g1_i1.p1  ORF type:complete len:105 (-),score=21.10 TRINITY_DN57363_c0_g1_i1:36-350(-)